ncbi:hypothetical protein PVAP13_1KG557101 [Panicum virgatum]|uniref:Uncharacterized protein n=1 Tax=Panicum virgatum TaxID=38727 RepID=A0A8T0XX43_PANVG|nr:hypothetical protein PVAP13_1KG557101 [Panicum virgatum]
MGLRGSPMALGRRGAAAERRPEGGWRRRAEVVAGSFVRRTNREGAGSKGPWRGGEGIAVMNRRETNRRCRISTAGSVGERGSGGGDGREGGKRKRVGFGEAGRGLQAGRRARD